MSVTGPELPAAPVDAALVVDGAEKRFGEVRALAGASFSVGRGELVGLLGPNGAGKTTAIRAIAGRVALDSGTLRLFGRVLEPSDRRPEVGVVPQEVALYRLLTARENLEVFARLYGVPPAGVRQRVEWALDWSGLRDRADEPVKQFSGGMQRRLNIACGLLHGPRLVLLDEPTVGVDPQSRERIYEMLDALIRDGLAIVLTTHHLEEAEQRCQRIVIIDHGRIVAAGTMAELVARTLETARVLTVSLDGPLPAAGALPSEIAVDPDGRTVRVRVEDVGREVPRRLEQIARAGGRIADMHLTGARLQDVFIALTGRELRE